MANEYFSHDYGTRNKRKMAVLLHHEKCRGYGLFWIIVEMLHEDSTKWMPHDDNTCIAIAKQSGEEFDYVHEFVEKCISKYEVFIKRRGKFTTDRVLRNIEKRDKVSESKRENALKRWKTDGSKDANALQKNAGAMHPEADAMQTDAKEIKGKERKGNKIKEENSPPPGVDEAGASSIDKKILYEGLNKTKGWITDFIRKNSPWFIEPYFDLWNVFATEKKLPKLSQITASRKRKFAIRVKEKDFDFIEVLRKAGQSEFMLSSNWFTFDWLIENDKNYLKVIEGNYDKKEPGVRVDKVKSDKPVEYSFEEKLKYLFERWKEGNLDINVIDPSDYDVLVTRYNLAIGTFKRMEGADDDEKKRNGVIAYFKLSSTQLQEA